jgi:glucan phosphoethanolaminetransferase (alkaline phosphatase superfamily)
VAFSVRRITWREWLGLAAGLLATASTFLPWTVLSAGSAAPDVQDAFATLPHSDVVRTAWHSDLFSWGPPLLLVVVGLAVALFGQIWKVRMSGLPQLWLVGGLATVLLMVIGWTTLGWVFDSDRRAFLEAAGITISAGVGRYLALAFAVGSAVVAVFDIRAARAESRASRRRR